MQFIKLDLSNAIASIKLQHAGGNRINFQMREEIFNAVESVAKSDARVLVIKGDGEDFCLGGDVRDWPDVPVDKLRPRVEVFANALDRLEQLDIPTIASVQGGCAGGGFELALACDMIIASRSARFSFPEALIGIMTLQGGVYNIAERIGRTKAVELVPHGLSLSADAADLHGNRSTLIAARARKPASVRVTEIRATSSIARAKKPSRVPTCQPARRRIPTNSDGKSSC